MSSLEIQKRKYKVTVNVAKIDEISYKGETVNPQVTVSVPS